MTDSDLTKSSPKKLLARCRPNPTGAGRDYLRRITRGLMPKCGQEWPRDVPTPSEEARELFSLKWLLRPTWRLRAKTDLSKVLKQQSHTELAGPESD